MGVDAVRVKRELLDPRLPVQPEGMDLDQRERR